MLSPIKNLREIVRCCQAGLPLNKELARWLEGSLNDFLVRNCRTVDDALGLRPPRGGVPWWLEEAMRQRDAALRNLVNCFYGTQRLCAQARLVRELSVRYGGSAWHRDRDSIEMPDCYRGKPHEWLWLAFKSGAPMPISERQLRKILHA